MSISYHSHPAGLFRSNGSAGYQIWNPKDNSWKPVNNSDLTRSIEMDGHSIKETEALSRINKISADLKPSLSIQSRCGKNPRIWSAFSAGTTRLALFRFLTRLFRGMPK